MHLKRLGNRPGEKTVKQTEGDVWACRGRQPFANRRGASEGAKPTDSSILDCQPPDPREKAPICCLSLLVSGTFLLAGGDLMKFRKVHVFFFFNYFVLRFFRKNTMSEGVVVNVYDLHMWILMDSPSADTGWGSGACPQEWGRFACFYPVMTDGHKAWAPVPAKQWWSYLKDFFLVWAVPCHGIFIKLNIL